MPCVQELNKKGSIPLKSSGWSITLARDQNIGVVGCLGGSVMAFSHNNKVFFFRAKFDGGLLDPDPKMELWSFDPNQLK